MVRKTADAALRHEKEAIKYVRLNVQFLAQTQQLCDEIFGKDYGLVKLPDATNLVWIACLEEKVVGFGTGLIEHAGVYNGITLSDQSVGIIHMIGVHPDFRMYGVGQQLIKLVAKDLGNIKIVGFGWEQNGILMIDKLFKSVGLKQQKRLGAIWKPSCDRGAFKCPDRINTCVCEAVLFSNE